MIDIEAERNAYGTQLDSFIATVDPIPDPMGRGGGDAWSGMECVFIRAPRLRRPGPSVEVLARVDGEPVLVRQGRRWACTFHPELTDDLRVHRAWLEGARARSVPAGPPADPSADLDR